MKSKMISIFFIFTIFCTEAFAEDGVCFEGTITWETGESHPLSVVSRHLSGDIYSVKILSDDTVPEVPPFDAVIGDKVAFRLDTKCKTIYSGHLEEGPMIYYGEAWCTTDVALGAKGWWKLVKSICTSKASKSYSNQDGANIGL